MSEQKFNKMSTNKDMLDMLPTELQKAQDAIHLPEVQEMLKKLSEYNLGIYMPHQHNETDGAFQLLPDDTMQLENDLEVSFSKNEDARSLSILPVGWVWRKEGMAEASGCVALGCQYVETPKGNPFHKKNHSFS